MEANRMKKFIWCILIFCQIVFAANVGIIPTPQSVLLSGHNISIVQNVDFTLIGDPQNLNMGQEILSEALAESGHADTQSSMSVFLEKKDDFTIDNISAEQLSEAYSLDISSDMIRVTSASDKGLFYGMMSLTQLVRASDDGTIPTLKILDYPDMAWRGISDDFSRGQVSTMKNFGEILRFLGEYKQNIYMPYMEDLVQIDAYPEIGSGRGALSKQDIAELQAMAEQYFVEVVPIFQTLGHYENILSDPAFRQYAEYPGAASLNSIDEKTDEFLFTMLDEVIPQFKSEYFHIGCDESWDVGLGATKALVRKNGSARVHADHYNKVYDKVTAEGKKVLMYGDIILRHPEIMDMIPNDIIIVDWHYRPSDHYPSIQAFKKAGFTFLVSPGVHNWRQSIPNFTNAWLNISKINYEGYLNGALGSINSSWGDYGGLNFREMNYLGYAFGAETSWNPSNMDGETIRQRFMKQYFGTDDISMESLFLVSNDIPNNTDLRVIFRNPFLPETANRRERLVSSANLIQSGTLTLELVDQLRGTGIRNADKLDYFEVGAKIALITGKKTVLKQTLDLYTENDYTDKITPDIRFNLIDECGSLISEINDMETRYRELWLRTNRPDNLDRLMNVFRQQATYIAKAKASLENGIYDINQELQSKWITAKVYKDGKDAPTAYLRKQFTIENAEDIGSAWLQVIANDAAEVYLNGQKVGTVAATKSGSLMAQLRRIAYWDVASFLKNGDNTIAVEVQAYKPGQPSSANVYFEYTAPEGKTVIMSDGSWQVATSVTSGWQTEMLKKGKWRKARIFKDYPKQLSMPIFDDGFPSQMEL